ncbi:ANTAR domain-containing response regulator [Amycolatopsis sp. FDAARGOS 1241]|uniref:ANTAR domain-containing response regulator n=1 Tax=Amycolatopsis sp. FDAARGOS 1241 TaxID=2778070 RepID=UPI00194F3ABF|nr:ANTAR domain-containing protein [Amycolatopsis sp. FDAARGOS 1241]QRP48437.1 ANTAR domain-containing protein [Amycolatopsis sp. FDAARGOS 1241]
MVISGVESPDREPTKCAPASGDDNDFEQLMESLTEENDQLRRALQTRELIAQATGVLMGQRHCERDEAFALLTKLSKDTNTKLRDVARAFLDEFHAECRAAPARADQPPPEGEPTR